MPMQHYHKRYCHAMDKEARQLHWPTLPRGGKRHKRKMRMREKRRQGSYL
jgi:hypothetical protein